MIFEASLVLGSWSLLAAIRHRTLSTRSRYPKDVEKTKLLAILEAAPESERRQAVEDIYWAVLSSKEFLFNH